MARTGGRSSSSLRPLSIVVESLDRVDGSAIFAFGETKVIASVSGPIQVRLAAELPSKALFEVIVRPLSGIAGTESKSLATNLRTLLTPSLVLTQNPRTLIQLVVQSLSPSPSGSSASLVAASINASTLALLRASSFPMLGVICASAVGREVDSKSGSRSLLLDPSDEELQRCNATGCVAVMFAAGSSSHGAEDADKMDEDISDLQGEVVWSSFQGVPLQSDYDALLRLAKSGAKDVYHAIRSQLREELGGVVIDAGRNAKKMPKHKGGRVALNVNAEDAMDMM